MVHGNSHRKRVAVKVGGLKSTHQVVGNMSAEHHTSIFHGLLSTLICSMSGQSGTWLLEHRTIS